MLRGLIAPIAALSGATLLLVYLASCSSDKANNREAEVPAMKEAGEKEEGRGVSKAQSIADKLPPIALPAPPRSASSAPVERNAPRVIDYLDRGCTTTAVKGLSEQIVAEANCASPGAYAKVPMLSNVKLSPAVFPYMQEPARNALVRALKKAKGREMKINSMLRTVAQQYLLFEWYKRKRCGIKLAAEPGTSNHQSGLAIDISRPGDWKKTLKRKGFRWMGKRDPWHFDFRGDGAKDRKGMDIQAFQRLWNRNHPDRQVNDDGTWGKSTRDALREAPANGFPVGPSCAAEPR